MGRKTIMTTTQERPDDRRNDDWRRDRRFGVGSRILGGTALAFLLVAGCGGWAMTAQLSGAVIASGSVMVEDNLKTIQHRDGGIVGEIAVKEGDVVAKGQVLLRLDDAQTRAELSIVRGQLMELEARRARLRAERDGLEAIIMPSELAAAAGADLQHIVNGERRLFEGNMRHRKSQKEQLALGIDQLGEEIRGLEAQRKAKLDEVALVREEHAKIKGLADKRLIEANRVYATDREMTRLLGEQGEIDAGIARARARISEIRIQILTVDEAARTEAQRELSAVDPRITELAERRTAIEDRLSRTDIRAPIAGTVNELSVHTIGGVITPAETLVTLVPEDARLTIAAKLPPTDIDQVSLGQPARLRFSTFNQRTTPELVGTVSYVSAATSTDKATGLPYYLAHIAVDDAELKRLGNNRLLPGMPLEVFVSTDDRTAISYLAKPLVDQFQRAFTEQ
jgi:HlyD family type I secretion membrane fusion protein